MGNAPSTPTENLGAVTACRSHLHLHNAWPLTNVVQMLKIPVFNPLSCDPG